MMEIRSKARRLKIARAEPRPDRRRLPAADDLRLERREPRAGGLADLALAEGAGARPRRPDPRACRSSRARSSSATTSGRSSPTCASPGSIEQDADLVMFIYRDEYYNDESDQQGLAEVHLAKHRNGPTDTVKLSFLKRYAKFADLAPSSMTTCEQTVVLLGAERDVRSRSSARPARTRRRAATHAGASVAGARCGSEPTSASRPCCARPSHPRRAASPARRAAGSALSPPRRQPPGGRRQWHTPARARDRDRRARSGATRARARSSTCSPSTPTSSAATRAGRTRGTRSSPAARRSSSATCPSGILHGKECVLGAGCVVDPEVFVEELDELEARGISTELRPRSPATRT